MKLKRPYFVFSSVNPRVRIDKSPSRRLTNALVNRIPPFRKQRERMGHPSRKTAQRLAAGKENCVDRKDESAVAGSGGKLGTRNAISGTVHSENSLSQHGKGYILGMFRRALALPLRGIRSS